MQEQSIANKKRLEARDPEARRRNLGELREIAADPARARQFLLRTSMIESQRRAAAMTLTPSIVAAMKIAVPDMISNSYFPAEAASSSAFSARRASTSRSK